MEYGAIWANRTRLWFYKQWIVISFLFIELNLPNCLFGSGKGETKWRESIIFSFNPLKLSLKMGEKIQMKNKELVFWTKLTSHNVYIYIYKFCLSLMLSFDVFFPLSFIFSTLFFEQNCFGYLNFFFFLMSAH